MINKKFLTALIGTSIIAIIAIIAVGSNQHKKDAAISVSPSNTLIFFYGNTCPHCADVEKWIDENQIDRKIAVVKKEVYENQDNARELTQTALSCNIDSNNIGVPLLYAEGTCLVGTTDIVHYLSTKANIK